MPLSCLRIWLAMIALAAVSASPALPESSDSRSTRSVGSGGLVGLDGAGLVPRIGDKQTGDGRIIPAPGGEECGVEAMNRQDLGRGIEKAVPKPCRGMGIDDLFIKPPARWR